MQTIEKFKLSELTVSQIAVWNSLAAKASASARIFSGHFFCRHIDGGQGGVEVVFIRQDNELVAVVPVQRDGLIGGALGAYRQVGQEISDYFSPLVAIGKEIDLPRALYSVGVNSLFIVHTSMDCAK